MRRLLSGVFFASGASALILENLWFRQAGLLLGNSVRATSIVLAAFMGGLALGSLLAARFGARITRLIRLYGLLELLVAITGISVIIVLPAIAALAAPLLRALTAHPVALETARLAIAFVLMLIPTTAMGATLPVLVTALCRRDEGFGRALGALYGWNTLGAVAGVLACELVLVPWLGIRGAAVAAFALSASTGAAALVISRSAREIAEAPITTASTSTSTSTSTSMTLTARRVLACTFVCGAVLLALEVVWFRLLALYVLGTTRALSLMLAVILAGIGIGGLAAGRWLVDHDEHAERALSLLAAAAAITVFGSFALFPTSGTPSSALWHVAVADTVRLALPTSLVSGALFAVLGTVARRAIGNETRAAGALVVWNTLGAMTGALLAGFVLLPHVGVDGGCFVACALYGAVALVGPRAPQRSRHVRLVELAALLVIAGCLSLFPFGTMRAHVYKLLAQVTSGDRAVVAYREGQTATLTILEYRWQDRPLYERLVTDGFSMSASAYNGRRYMKTFVYLPVALAPAPKQALLVCYGVGQTAKALTDTASLEHIDVVDISRDILALAPVVYPVPGTSPLDDPRVDTHVEDGRFYLQTSERSYDLITGEPPPPRVAGVVTLYTREYFALIHDHLTRGGMTTYWLPVHALSLRGAQSIVRAFCDVFDDCSLWTGFGHDWMLVGSRGGAGGISEEQFSRQWSDPRVASELRAIGLEQPEQLGAMFIADRPGLMAWAASAPILDDDHPARIDPDGDPDIDQEAFRTFMDASAAHDRFQASPWIARLWPAGLRARTLPQFAVQEVINMFPYVTGLAATSTAMLDARIAAIERIQSTSTLRTPVLWMFGYTAANERIMDTLTSSASPDAELDLARGVRALADHHFAEAAVYFDRVVPAAANATRLAAYARAMDARAH